ncbi:unnamed protein product [Ixodes persulcatus]
MSAMQRSTMTVAQLMIRMSFIEPSTIRKSLTVSTDWTVSAKPTTYMATATALAREKMSPMAPPNSGPRLRDIM